MVAHELASGAALVPKIGAMSGAQAVSETSLINQVLAHCRERYRRALHHAPRDKLPNREGRHYPREAYKKRPPSSHFKTRKPPLDPPPVDVN